MRPRPTLPWLVLALVCAASVSIAWAAGDDPVTYIVDTSSPLNFFSVGSSPFTGYHLNLTIVPQAHVAMATTRTVDLYASVDGINDAVSDAHRLELHFSEHFCGARRKAILPLQIVNAGQMVTPHTSVFMQDLLCNRYFAYGLHVVNMADSADHGSIYDPLNPNVDSEGYACVLFQIDCTPDIVYPAEPTVPQYALLGESKRDDDLHEVNLARGWTVPEFVVVHDVDLLLQVNQTGTGIDQVLVEYHLAAIEHVISAPLDGNWFLYLHFGYNQCSASAGTLVIGDIGDGGLVVPSSQVGGESGEFQLPVDTCDQQLYVTAYLTVALGGDSGDNLAPYQLLVPAVGGGNSFASGGFPGYGCIRIPLICPRLEATGSFTDGVLSFIASNALGGQKNLAVAAPFVVADPLVPYVFDSRIRMFPSETFAVDFTLEFSVEYALEPNGTIGTPHGYYVEARLYLNTCGVNETHPGYLATVDDGIVYVASNETNVDPVTISHALVLDETACGQTVNINVRVYEAPFVGNDTVVTKPGDWIHQATFSTFTLFAPNEWICVQYVVPCNETDGGVTPFPPRPIDDFEVCSPENLNPDLQNDLVYWLLILIGVVAGLSVVCIPTFCCGGILRARKIRFEGTQQPEQSEQ